VAAHEIPSRTLVHFPRRVIRGDAAFTSQRNRFREA
jgi:hypothetical protein